MRPDHMTLNVLDGNGHIKYQHGYTSRLSGRDINAQIPAVVSATLRDALEGNAPPPDKTISAHKFLWISASHFMTLWTEHRRRRNCRATRQQDIGEWSSSCQRCSSCCGGVTGRRIHRFLKNVNAINQYCSASAKQHWKS